MANEEHLKILKQGVEVWNQWRKENPKTRPDLVMAYLSGADLNSANLSGVHLYRADLNNADLSHANLSGADLRRARLSGADLSEADLSEADLSDANLSRADLISANLSGAILKRADPRGADLRRADLNSADLSHANLSEADLSEAHLSRANLTLVTIGWTTFGNIDLSEVSGLDTVRHIGPSTIGIDTIYTSKGNIPYKFLLDAGVPKDDIHYLLSLAGKAMDFYSCFISYSSQDKAFAERLHADLQVKGVRCWYEPEDMKIGDEIRSTIDQAIRHYDKLLIVLSEQSLNSRRVQKEVEIAFEQEEKEGRLVLFPVRLDDTVMETSHAWAADIRRLKHIGDFTKWEHYKEYQIALDRLLRDLQTTQINKGNGQ